jgi:uncharacterized membrane protein YfcA
MVPVAVEAFGLLAIGVIVLALVLALQARHAEAAAEPAQAQDAGARGRTLLALALCLGFAGISLGHGLPFVVEGAVFIFVFTTLFSLPVWRAERRVKRGLLRTLAIAVLASSFIAWLFESVFLVRLP